MKITEKDKIRRLYALYTDLGMLKELPDRRQEKNEYLLRCWNMLIDENPRFPSDLGDNYKLFLSATFFNALVHNTAVRKGNNISALCEAFAHWYDSHQHNKCKKLFYNKYPHERPKQLTSQSDKSEIESWPDHTIKEQLAMIKEVFRDDASGLLNTEGAKSYFTRIQTEFNKRGL